jgi:hypothetical protein
MIEVYLFYAMFTAQILVFSVLYPATMIRNVRAALARFPVERRPFMDEQAKKWFDRRLALYRQINTGIAIVGLLLLGWLFSYMRRPDWDDGTVETLLVACFLLQMVPTALLVWELARGNRQLRELLRGEKRMASLERRRLFDFVSPFVVGLTVLCYLLHAALAVYIAREPFPGFAGAFVNVAITTLMCAGIAFLVYRVVYGKKSSPLLTHEDHLWEIEVTVKILVYTCMVSMLALSLVLVLGKLEMQSVEPLAQSTVFVIIGVLLCGMGRLKMPQPGAAKAT